MYCCFDEIREDHEHWHWLSLIDLELGAGLTMSIPMAINHLHSWPTFLRDCIPVAYGDCGNYLVLRRLCGGKKLGNVPLFWSHEDGWLSPEKVSFKMLWAGFLQ